MSSVQVFEAEWDQKGVYFYQAYNDKIADWALEHQKFGGPDFNPSRMTWIKPSLAWMLFRAGYAKKHNQERILKIKLSHETVAELLSQCDCKHGGGGSFGRVQWDPARDILSSDGKEPTKLTTKRAIQIGLKGKLSEFYVSNILSIEDVTQLAHKVGEAHASKNKEAIEVLVPELPIEREYLPRCSQEVLESLGMVPGKTADNLARLGKGKAFEAIK